MPDDLRLQGRIRDEMSIREGKLTEVDTRLENEIGLLRAACASLVLLFAFLTS